MSAVPRCRDESPGLRIQRIEKYCNGAKIARYGEGGYLMPKSFAAAFESSLELLRGVTARR